jgi:hypothetical protein
MNQPVRSILSWLNALTGPSCEELVREEVFRSSSLFGRLAAISSLRRAEGDYHRQYLSTRFRTTEIDRVLQRLHMEAFTAWLSLTLSQQESDLRAYLANRTADKHGTNILIPLAAHPAQVDSLVQGLCMVASKLRAESCRTVSGNDEDSRFATNLSWGGSRN